MISRNKFQQIQKNIFSLEISANSIFTKSLFVIFLVFILCIGLIIYFYVDFSKSKIILPTERFDYAKEHPSEFTAKELDDVYKINYEYVSLNSIPKTCKDSLIAIEDKTFYTNSGIDRNGILRLYVSLVPGINIGGGSTISQQVIKMSSDRFYRRNILDKFKEIVWSIRLNKEFTKEEILEKYFNNAYYGDFNYGIQSASKEYYGKDVSELSLDECAYLGGIPQLPNVYRPIDGVPTREGLERQQRVLNALEDLNKD